MNEKPILGITMGDPSGVGSEIIVKTLGETEYYDMARPIVIGDAIRMKDSLKFVDEKLEIHTVSNVGDAKFEYGFIDVLHNLKGSNDIIPTSLPNPKKLKQVCTVDVFDP